MALFILQTKTRWLISFFVSSISNPCIIYGIISSLMFDGTAILNYVLLWLFEQSLHCWFACRSRHMNFILLSDGTYTVLYVKIRNNYQDSNIRFPFVWYFVYYKESDITLHGTFDVINMKSDDKVRNVSIFYTDILLRGFLLVSCVASPQCPTISTGIWAG